jgi:hypothetical protein
MTTNPFIEQSVLLQKERSIIIKHGSKFTIKGVYDWDKPINEEVFDMMRIFCNEHHIGFTLRPFDSSAYVEDREELTKLPAYQIYIYEEYEASLYPGPECVSQARCLLLKQEKQLPPKSKKWFSWKFPTLKLRLKKPPMLSHEPKQVNL